MRYVVPEGLIRCWRAGVLAAPATFLLLASGFVLLVIGFAASSDSAGAPVVVPVAAVSSAQGAPGDAGADPSGDYAAQQVAAGNASAAKPSPVNNSGGSAKRNTGSSQYQQTTQEMAAKSGKPTPETVGDSAVQETPRTPVTRPSEHRPTGLEEPQTPVATRAADQRPTGQQTPVIPLSGHQRRPAGESTQSAEEVPATPVATVAARRQPGGAAEEVPVAPVAAVAGRRVADARPTGARVDEQTLPEAGVRRAIRAATATGPTDEELPASALTRTDPRGNQAGEAWPSGRKAPGQDVLTLLDGGADLVSGIVGTVAGRRAGERTHEALSGVAEDVTRALRVGTRLAGSGGSSLPDADQIRDTAQRRVDTALRQVGERLDKIGKNGAGNAKGLFLEHAAAAPGCAQGERCGPATEQARTMLAGGTGTRGPPAERATDTEEDRTYQLTAFDPEAQRAARKANDQALNDRLAVINGQRGLDDAKKQLDAGKLTQAEYDKKVAAQKGLQTTSDASMTKVSPENAQLINYVVDGQQRLGPGQAALDQRGKDLDAAWDTQRKNLAAGKFDIPGLVNTAIASGQYRRDVAEFDRYRDGVNAATDRLRGLTGHDDITLGDPGRNGVACGSSGAFSRCEGASFGQERSCQGLAGVSACNVAVGSGSAAASGKCPIDGGGCTTSATFEGHTASSGCRPGAYCQTTATADWSGAYGECEAAKGCTGDSAARQGSREVSTATGKCEGDCGLWASAGADGVGESHCQAGGGACDTDSTSTRTAPQPLAAPGTAQPAGPAGPNAQPAGPAGPNAQPAGSAGPNAQPAAPAGPNAQPAAPAGPNAQPAASTGPDGASGAGQDPRGRTARASSHCQSNNGRCATFATADVNSEASARAGADVDCGGRAGCAGTGSTRTNADAASGTGAKRHGETKSDCVVAAGSCHAGDQARADNPLRLDPVISTAPATVPGSWFGEPGGPAFRTVDGDASGEGTARATVDCAGVTGCSGAAHTSTAAGVTSAPTGPGKPGATRETHGQDSCLVTSADGCTSQSHSRADDQSYPTQWFGYGGFGGFGTGPGDGAGDGQNGRDFGGPGWTTPTGPAPANPAPAGSSGTGTGVGAGSGTGPGAGHGGTGGRLSTQPGASQLTACGTGLDCGTDAPDPAANGTTRTRGPPAPARQVSASSQAGSQIDCFDPSGCDASSISQTGGSASGDVPYRDSTGESTCNLRSATGCASRSTTEVTNRPGAPDGKITATPDTPSDDRRAPAPGSAPVGQGEPVSTSHATAEGGCPADATGCTSQTRSATTSLNTAVSDRRTGSDATANCTGGACVTPSHSDASTEPDYVVYDGATRQPLAEQPTRGATSNSGSNARTIPTAPPADQRSDQPGDRPADQDDPKTAPVRPVAQVSNWFNNGANNHGNGNNGNNNSGFYNTGDNNLGDHNQGNANVGNRNVGNANTGNQNIGNANTGNANHGNGNLGNQNRGNGNVGNQNTGNGNRGNANRGNQNTGNANQGDFNIGDTNVGNRNVGNANHGSYNSGNNNQGSYNAGSNNRGSYNIGNANHGSHNVGSGNRGNRNVGNANVGDYNVGSGNVGSHNVGSGNVGSHNVGSGNVGSHNIGNANHGSYNVGNANRGNRNVGSGNVGSHNVGSGNHGSFNIGDANTGSYNRGSGNVGSHNVGNANRGSYNVGSGNRGSHNVGNANVGSHNVGSGNHGSYNVGNGNRGNRNVGNGNVGDYNVGSGNVGSHNVGNANHGSYNVGNGNRGSHNVGNGNVGNYNRGNSNVGSHNVGNGNQGSYNVGDANVGNHNRGNGNVGNHNVGSGNRGDYNRGNGNVGNRNVGNGNRGNDNRGDGNIGNANVGNYNRGDGNHGSYNVGNQNDGSYNVGNHNVGNHNVGDRNRGDYNRGNDNVGNRNVGNANHGNDNIGNRNVGNRNHGDDNKGNDNVGDRNVGNANHGNDNIGNRNHGNSNKGDDNIGDRNVGNRNHGNNNHGDENVGNNNVGNRNHGNDNKGDDNVGNRNVGNRNQGDDNKGNDNIGNRNVGNSNTGDDNHGNSNVGNRNKGNNNAGDDNVGNDNVGNRNHGDRNVGDDNHGSDNAGDRNHGDRNIGNDNKGNDNVGDRNKGNNNQGNDNRGNNNTGNNNKGNDNVGNNLNGNKQKSTADILTDPRFLAGVGTNGLKNYKRAEGTFGDAAKRHNERAAKARASGDWKTAAREEKLAQGYQGLSDRLKHLTSPHAKGTPLSERLKRPLGNLPDKLQRGLAQSAFDHINRPGVPGQHPVRNMFPFLRKAEFGGDNLKELARRGLTKVGGVTTLAFAGYDIYNSIKAGDSVPHAVVKTGSSVVISAAVGAGTQAAVAAGLTAMAVPGAGWAVGAGILAGAAASYFLTKYDVPNKIADGAVWLGGKIGDGAKAVGNGIANGAKKVAKFLGF